jgi:hypothetical protein
MNSDTAPSSESSPRPASWSARSPSVTARPPTRHTCSPGTPSGWRLVAITRSDWERSSSATIRSAHPSTTCSQLSSTSRVASGNRWASAAGAGSLVSSLCNTVDATTCATRWGSNVDDRSTHQAPPTKSGRIASATAIARRVFPAPPGPARVRTRVRHTSDRSSPSAASRPTSLVSWTGRFPSASSPGCLVWVAVSSIRRWHLAVVAVLPCARLPRRWWQ